MVSANPTHIIEATPLNKALLQNHAACTYRKCTQAMHPPCTYNHYDILNADHII